MASVMGWFGGREGRKEGWILLSAGQAQSCSESELEAKDSEEDNGAETE